VLGTPPTHLERQLAGEPVAQPTPLDCFRDARQRFLAGDRLDMGDIARSSGVSRATLYRWVGSRDRLLGEILGSIADAAFSQADRSASGTGADRVLDVLKLFFEGVLRSAPYRRFVEAEPQLALRLCTSKAGPVQGRLIRRIESLLERENVPAVDELGQLTRADLAYALLRLGEAFVYSDVITGSEPDVDRALPLFSRLLR
jgi:AcrR family transcriptional regulator